MTLRGMTLIDSLKNSLHSLSWLVVLGAVSALGDEPAWNVVSTSPITIKTRDVAGKPVREFWAEGEIAAPVKDIEDALMQDCTHALFLDTDQIFPMDTAHRLLKWKKSIVACNVPLKVMPSFPTARARSDSPFGSPIFSPNSSVGLEKVWRVGAGVMMIDLAILEKIEKPWFEIRYSDKHAQFVGEDWYFVKKVEDVGFDVFVDHELSRQIGHVGQFQYTHAHIPAVVVEEAA